MSNINSALSEWQSLHITDMPSLADTRAQLHHAVQLPSAVGRYMLAAKEDDSHTNLEWVPDTASLCSGILQGAQAVRVGIRLADLTLLLYDENGEQLREYALHGHTQTEALFWLSAQLEAYDNDTSSLTLKMPYDEEMPAHVVASGAAYDASDSDRFSEFTRYYANFHLILEAVRDRFANASAVRCWPHHFDIATLITTKSDPDPEKAGTIGIGLSPGDSGYTQPYVYITPWPYPDPGTLDLPQLPSGGIWNTEHWFGAVLTAENFVATEAAAGQGERVAAFMQEALKYIEGLKK